MRKLLFSLRFLRPEFIWIMVEQSLIDHIYAEPLAEVGDFVFDDKVAAVFPDMLRRSIPGYTTIIRMIGLLATTRVPANGICYDLGCSLGAAALVMGRAIRERQGQVIAVDNSAAMIAGAKALLAREEPPLDIRFRQEDIQNVALDNASMVVLNFTMQFVPPAERESLLQGIYRGMRPGAILVLSEKIAFDDESFQQLFSDMHHQFKKDQGYTDLEVSQKRSALEKVLIPETLERHRQRLGAIGFSRQALWFQCFNFMSLLAVK